MEDEGWKLLLLCRLSPLIPYNVLNITMASTKIHFWPFAIVSFFGKVSWPCKHTVRMPDRTSRLLASRLSADALRLVSAGVIPECAFFVYTGEPITCSLSLLLCQAGGAHTSSKPSKIGGQDQKDQTSSLLQAP